MWTYEVVAMIIAHLLSNTYLPVAITCLACGVEEVLWKKLTGFVVMITGALCFSHIYVNYHQMKSNTNVVDKNVNGVRVLANQLGCIILFLRLVNATLEVSYEGLLSPGCIDGV